MKIIRFTVFVLIILLVLSLSACKRSLPTPEASPTPVTEGGEVQPGATDIFDNMLVFATQTAMVQTQVASGDTPAGGETGDGNEGGEAGPGPEEATPEPPAQTEPTVPVVPTATKPAANIPPPTPGIPTTYTLQKGEFPYCIARRFNVDQSELLNMNGLSGNYFSPGMTLSIPQTGNPFRGPRSLRDHPTTYVVTAGETINSIACLFGSVSPEEIIAANGLVPPYALNPGQTLQIP